MPLQLTSPCETLTGRASLFKGTKGVICPKEVLFMLCVYMCINADQKRTQRFSPAALWDPKLKLKLSALDTRVSTS